MICQRWRPDSYEPFVQRGWSICNLSTQASTPWGCTSPILGWVSTVSHRECAWMQLSWISLHGIDLASFYSTSREGWPCARQMLYIDSLVRRLCMLLQPNMTLVCASRSAWPLLLRGMWWFFSSATSFSMWLLSILLLVRGYIVYSECCALVHEIDNNICCFCPIWLGHMLLVQHGPCYFEDVLILAFGHSIILKCVGR